MESKYQYSEQQVNERPLSYSSLKEFRKSPRHFIKYLTEPYERTEAMILGSVVDCLTLEPEKFDKRFLVWEKFDRRSNDAKQKYSELLTSAQENKQTLVTMETVEQAKRCVSALMDNEQSRILIEGRRKVQVRLKWTDRDSRLPMIGYVDFDTEAWGQGFIVDLKTATSADPDEFNRAAGKLDYQLQTGTYLSGYPRCFFKFPLMVFLVVETDDPFNVSVMFCDPKYTEASMNEFHGTLNAFRYCLDNQLFHQGYEFRLMGTQNYHLMNLPKYLKPKFVTV